MGSPLLDKTRPILTQSMKLYMWFKQCTWRRPCRILGRLHSGHEIRSHGIHSLPVEVIRNDGVGGSNPSCGTIFQNVRPGDMGNRTYLRHG